MAKKPIPDDQEDENPSAAASVQREIIAATYVQARSSQILAWIFVVCGALVFAVIYERRIAPDVEAAMRDISTAGLILAAFLPAILLFFLARRYEKKYHALLKDLPEGTPPAE